MRYLIAAAVLMASPAFAGQECYAPHGSLNGTARWSGRSKIIETYLTTSNGDRYTCGPDFKLNNPSLQAGSKGYFKQTCGPLTIVREVSFRNCTFEERAGISGRIDRYTEADAALAKRLCASRSNITADVRYELRDKNGEIFQLGTYYGIDIGNVKVGATCNSNKKTVYITQTWNVGESSKEIMLVRVTEYQAEVIIQPSL